MLYAWISFLRHSSRHFPGGNLVICDGMIHCHEQQQQQSYSPSTDRAVLRIPKTPLSANNSSRSVFVHHWLYTIAAVCSVKYDEIIVSPIRAPKKSAAAVLALFYFIFGSSPSSIYLSAICFLAHDNQCSIWLFLSLLSYLSLLLVATFITPSYMNASIYNTSIGLWDVRMPTSVFVFDIFGGCMVF